MKLTEDAVSESFCGTGDSFLPHPPLPPDGTNGTRGSFPRFSLFKDDKCAGVILLVCTLPKLCNPWPRFPKVDKSHKPVKNFKDGQKTFTV